MHEKDKKEDVMRFRQKVYATQTFSKKEILKRLFCAGEK